MSAPRRVGSSTSTFASSCSCHRSACPVHFSAAVEQSRHTQDSQSNIQDSQDIYKKVKELTRQCQLQRASAPVSAQSAPIYPWNRQNRTPPQPSGLGRFGSSTSSFASSCSCHCKRTAASQCQHIRQSRHVYKTVTATYETVKAHKKQSKS